ncbi:MAG: PilZ domain-containing protein [Acidobacteria bacterium]|nr:PilZ domain-containing protein [Acidobacteriota bacterium]
MDGDKRDTPRLDIRGRIPGELAVLAPIAVRDISLTGALVECAYPLVMESAHELRLHLGNQAVVIRSRVAHCHIADIGHDMVRYVAGLEFLDVSPHAEAAIAGFVERLKREREAAPGQSPAPPASG